MSAGKRMPLSIETKLEVLEAMKYKSKIDIARDFGIGYSTVKKIKKDEEEILKKVSANTNLFRKRDRQSPNEEVGKALITWFHQMKKQNLPLNGPIMLEKAKEIACTLGYEDFKPSHGWLERLKARNNIKFQKPSTKQSVNCNINNSKNESEDWIKNVLPSMIEEYDPDNVFNATESVLFYKAAPAILMGNYMQNGVVTKDRLTVLFLCNATGNEKHIFVIGKQSNPPCFETEGTPLPYYSNTNAAMTDLIWRDILQKVDESLGERKIILFVNNVACHRTKLKLKNIKIVLFPTDSCLIPPLDRGVIRSLKIHYRHQLLQKMISVSNKGIPASDFAKTIDLLQTLRMLEAAWSSVSPSMIVDCFQKAGFYTDDVYCLDGTPDISVEASELKELLQEEFDEFIECDKTIDCFESSADCSKTASDISDEPDSITVDDSVVINNVVPRVTHEEAMNALSIVRRYLDENFTDYNAYFEIEEMIRLNAYANSANQNEVMDSFEFNY